MEEGEWGMSEKEKGGEGMKKGGGEVEVKGPHILSDRCNWTV